jgi:hypothetical protein
MMYGWFWQGVSIMLTQPAIFLFLILSLFLCNYALVFEALLLSEMILSVSELLSLPMIIPTVCVWTNHYCSVIRYLVKMLSNSGYSGVIALLRSRI